MAVKRLMAILGAVVMVIGALVVRGFLDDGGELSLGGSSSTIYCDSAIADACRSVFDSADLVIEAPGATLERLLDDTDDGAAVWIAADLWFDILEAEQVRSGQGAEITSRSDPIAHSPLVLLGDECDPVAWSCFGELPASVDVGIDSLDTSSGLAAWTQIVATELGSPSFAANDFDLGFNEWRRNLQSHTRFSPVNQPVLDIYLTRPGTYDLIVTPVANVGQLGRDDLGVVPEDPAPDLQIGALALDGARLPGALDDLGNELEDASWQAGAAPEAERPSGGAMQALRS